MTDTDVIIVGAGACGLMAARELAKKGKKVIILEARNRIGGRIYPLDEVEFGYPAQGGAEFIHGKTPITRGLLKEFNLTYTPMQGEMWLKRRGEFYQGSNPAENQYFFPNQELIIEKLRYLKEDIPIREFLDLYFKGEEHQDLRDSVINMVEDYDAADSNDISTFELKDDWLGGKSWEQGRIKEGYGKLVDHLKSDCENLGVNIFLNKEVKEIISSKEGGMIKCVDNSALSSKQVIVTVPLPVIQNIVFSPAIPDVLEKISKIGFGLVIKVIVKFNNKWWAQIPSNDLEKLTFLLVINEKISPWWTQFPRDSNVLTGWISGPAAKEFDNLPDDKLLDLCLDSLVRTFGVDKTILEDQIETYKIINWNTDPYSMGAYSYSKVETKNVYEDLIKPINKKVFLAGEAFFSGEETATVEGALSNGVEVAKRILTN